ncbi:MAG: hypothetical protein LBH01_09375 [Verrucomicrobiales bacterium]|jgi:hypothetical protein|nr:hypothetical protein [Verrucomicrobiales bacterium]
MNKFSQLKQYLPVGALGISLFIHLAIFLAISGIIIIHAVDPKTPFVAAGPANADLTPLPSPEEPDPQPATDPGGDPSPDSSPASAPALNIEQISSNASSITPSFAVPVFDSNSLSNGSGLSSMGKGGGGKGSGKGGGTPVFSPFGSSDISGGGLKGDFFDLKFTKDKQPTNMDPQKWLALITRFANSNWAADYFQNYLRSPNPLVTRQIFVSYRHSEEAPKAFQLPNSPGYWVAIYRGTATPPADGNYTFCGFGDDTLLVRVNGKIVLDAGWFATAWSGQPMKVYPSAKPGAFYKTNNIHIGKTFSVKGGQPIQIEILIGDLNLMCGYFLFIKNEAKTYQKRGDGTELLPLFQIGEIDFKPSGEYPAYSQTPEPWK